MTIIVADASVVIKWFVPEADSEQAARLLASNAEFHAPDLLRHDIAHLLWRRALRGEVTPDQSRLIRGELERIIAHFHDSRDLIAAAYAEALERQHPLHDLVYFELARQLRAPLISAKHGFLSVMPWASVIALEDWKDAGLFHP